MIGISGRIGAGKDTVADYLVATHNYTKYSFSTPLKKALQQIFHFNENQLWGDKKEVVDDYWHQTPRYLMQICGSELFRDELSKYCHNFGKDIWIMSFEKQQRDDINYVIADARFSNEIDFIKKNNGLTVRITRPTDSFAKHQSENLEFDADIWLNNNGTLNDLYNQIEERLIPFLPERNLKAKIKYFWFWHNKKILTLVVTSFFFYLIN